MSVDRLIAIGDLHGCLDHLVRLIRRIRPTRSDTLVFLGDYVAHGPNAPGVLEFLIDLATSVPCVFLRGDHDEEFIRALAGQEPAARWVFENRGGRHTVSQYGGYERVPAAHREFLTRTELGYEREGYLFVHAGLRPGVPVDRQDPQDLLWGADTFWQAAPHAVPYVTVCGHWAQARPLINQTLVMVDTGAVFDNLGHLTAVDVRRQVWVSSTARAVGEIHQARAA